MGWIEIAEPYAALPRTVEVAPVRDGPEHLELGPDGSWAELFDTSVGGDGVLPLGDVAELVVRDSVIGGPAFAEVGPDGLQVEMARSRLDGCDLSPLRFSSIIGSTLSGCKLTGTDLSGSTIVDTVLERCTLRYVNLRMASLERVTFVDCVLADVDAYRLVARDVGFPGTTLTGFGVDGLDAERVDLRDAVEVSLTAVNGLTGCLVAEHQLPALVYTLAFAAGVDIEAPSRDEDLAGN